MNRFFNPENSVLNFFGKVLDCVWLNILWLLCCLPVVTIGPATAALYYCTLKLAEDRKCSLTQDFFHSFRQNLKEGSLLTLLFLGLGACLFIDGRFFFHMRYNGPLYVAGFCIFVFLLAIYVLDLIYVFPLLSRFDNTPKNMIRNAFVIAVRFLIVSFLMIAVDAVVIFVTVRFFAPLLLIGGGLAALINSYLLKTVFAYVEASQEKAISEL